MDTPLVFISTSNFLCNGGKALCEQSSLSHVLHDTPIGISVDLSLIFIFSVYTKSFAYLASQPRPIYNILFACPNRPIPFSTVLAIQTYFSPLVILLTAA